MEIDPCSDTMKNRTTQDMQDTMLILGRQKTKLKSDKPLKTENLGWRAG